MGDSVQKPWRVAGHVDWKGVGVEALRGMTTDELVDYANMLERALYDIHRHFYYLGPKFSGDLSSLTAEDIGFDGRWRDIGANALSASLRMYAVHKTPFVPVGRPASVKENL